MDTFSPRTLVRVSDDLSRTWKIKFLRNASISFKTQFFSCSYQSLILLAQLFLYLRNGLDIEVVVYNECFLPEDVDLNIIQVLELGNIHETYWHIEVSDRLFCWRVFTAVG